MSLAALAAAALALAVAPARADMGPKPFVEFQLVDHSRVHHALVSAEHRQCSDAACTTFHVQPEGPYNGIFCQKNACSTMEYGYDSPWHQLALRFVDKVRVSNAFENSEWYATFTVFVRDDDLQVEKVFGSDMKTRLYGPKLVEEIFARGLQDRYGLQYWLQFPWSQKGYDAYAEIYRAMRFTIAYSLTLFLELTAAALAFARRPNRRRLMTTVLVANLISVPLLWLYCASFTPMRYSFAVISSEVAVFLFEGLFLFGFNRELGVAPALGWSLLFNAVSFVGGELITGSLPQTVLARAVLWRWLQLNPHPNPW